MGIQAENLNVAVENGRNTDNALALEAAVAGAACQRYEKHWIHDSSELKKLQQEHLVAMTELIELRDTVSRSEARHLNIMRDLEDEVEFMRGREVSLSTRVR